MNIIDIKNASNLEVQFFDEFDYNDFCEWHQQVTSKEFVLKHSLFKCKGNLYIAKYHITNMTTYDKKKFENFDMTTIINRIKRFIWMYIPVS